MKYDQLFAYAKPYLEKNDLGAAHTNRVLATARTHFSIPPELEELTICAIILHDIGGSSIKEQYEKGPEIASSLLKKMGCDEDFVSQVSLIVGTHHDHPDEPSAPFRILYDADKLVMFSHEEFPVYDSRPNFDWDKIIDLFYSEKAKHLARENLKKRREEQ
ncbi:MAG: HD domain-containing protein [Candidatus Bathyarchaeota archaeon]|nr:HD domain-containing protein [Candidatus Bathyarchaeota archaeon]